MPNLPILSFNTGEVSPLIDARSDVAKYASACRVLQNMIPRIYGIAQRRPGTKFIKLTQNPNVMSRLIPFIYSEEIAYIVEHGDQSARFYFDGGELVDGSGNHVSVATPYLSADLNEIHYKQSNDVQWLVHKSYIPRKLTRTTATSFALNTIPFTGGPFLKRHDLDVGDGVTLTPSAITGSGTLTASGDTFEAGHVGSVWQLTQPRVNTDISGNRKTAGILGTAMIVEGVYTFSTSGTWRGTVRIQRSEDAGVTYETVKTYTQQALYTGTESGNDVLYRINVTSMESGKIRATLSVNSATQDGIVRITGFNSATEATYTVDKTLASTDATARWAEGAWSGVRGYPRTMTFFEERTVYAGTLHQPQTIWLSASGKYECFKEGTADNDSFSLTLSSDTRNSILWITALEALVFGTSGGEWRLRSSRFDEPLTPTNFSIKQQTTKGSKAIQALQVDSAVMFVDSVGRKVREMSLDSNTGEKYVAPDMNALAEHITKTGIVAIAHQKNPDSILWAIRGDGYLLSMTYEREQDVVAWARHPLPTGGASADYRVPPAYPTLQIADGAFQVRTPSPTLVHGTPISNVTELQAIESSLAGNFYLTQEIDATATKDWNGGLGFDPIDGFTGTLDGAGHKITNLVINRPTEIIVGMFGVIDPAATDVIVADLTLENCNINGKNSSIGSIVGQISPTNAGSVTFYNCHVSGTVVANGSTGVDSGVGGFVGIIGSATDVIFYDCTSSCMVDVIAAGEQGDEEEVGGFAGSISSGPSKFYNCRASGLVTGDTDKSSILGGFFGTDTSSADTTIYQDCSASGNVSGGSFVGGFGGISVESTFIRCSAKGSATAGGGDVGGFVANTFGTGCTWTDCYSWANAIDSEASNNAGGFVGSINANTNFTNCYAIGAASGLVDPTFGSTGGFVGWDFGGNSNYTSCFWDKETSGLSTDGHDGGGVGHSTEWMKTKANFTREDWDFDTVWFAPTPTLWTGLGVNSVAVIPGDGEDEVWLIVARVINGQLRRMIEQMQPRDFGNQEDAWFLDSALDYTGVATSSFTGLDHLEGEEVGIWGNGAIFTRQTVVDGKVALDSEVTRAIVGLPFRYILKPMRFDLQTRSGSTKGSIKKIGEVVISFYQTLMAKYGKDVDHLLGINWRTTEPYDSPPDMHTGDKVAVADSGFDSEDGFMITGDDPAPCSVRAIILREKVTGR